MLSGDLLVFFHTHRHPLEISLQKAYLCSILGWLLACCLTSILGSPYIDVLKMPFLSAGRILFSGSHTSFCLQHLLPHFYEVHLSVAPQCIGIKSTRYCMFKIIVILPSHVVIFWLDIELWK